MLCPVPASTSQWPHGGGLSALALQSWEEGAQVVGGCGRSAAVGGLTGSSPRPACGGDMGRAVRAELGEEPGLVLGEAICFPEAAGRPSPSGPGPTLGAVREPRCIQGPMGTLGPPPSTKRTLCAGKPLELPEQCKSCLLQSPPGTALLISVLELWAPQGRSVVLAGPGPAHVSERNVWSVGRLLCSCMITYIHTYLYREVECLATVILI